MPYDPYSNYSPASSMPSYYDPYSTYTDRGQSMRQAQQDAQAGVPGRDTPSPEVAPTGDTTAATAARYRTVRLKAPTGQIKDVPVHHANHYIQRGATLVY